MNYEYAQVIEVIVYPSNTKATGNSDIHNGSRLLKELLDNGFDIYQAIRFATNETAGIKYILRKEKTA